MSEGPIMIPPREARSITEFFGATKDQLEKTRSELNTTQTYLEDMQTHIQIMHLLLEVYHETATPEQTELFRGKMKKLLDHYDEHDEMQGARDIADIYWF